MRAAVMRANKLVVCDVADPVPGPTQVLVETAACGICGSDLHCLRYTQEFVETSRESGQTAFVFDVGRDVVMGHEFSARVLDPGASRLRPGDPVVAFPVMPTARGAHTIGYSNVFPGGYGERMLLHADTCLPVPNGLDLRHAALTEPTAVGLHAVNRSEIAAGDAALVLGCGPVGLMTIAALGARQVEPIVAADLSPKRRELARAMGAHTAVDPRDEPAIDAWRRLDPRSGERSRRLVLYEAVGVPGMIDRAMRDAPRDSRIIVVGLCMQADRLYPTIGVNKELLIQFVLGWTPQEFVDSLRALAEGAIDPTPLITGEVGIDQVPDAFEWLANPEAHAKILVCPDL
jgi:hypothetical protein